jgi:hypothetical protein
MTSPEQNPNRPPGITTGCISLPVDSMWYQTRIVEHMTATSTTFYIPVGTGFWRHRNWQGRIIEWPARSSGLAAPLLVLA